MCGCTICVLFQDIHNCFVMFRSKMIAKWKAEIGDMDDGPEKISEEELWKAYVQQVCKDKDGRIPKYESAWDAAQEMGCEPIAIGDKQYHSISPKAE